MCRDPVCCFNCGFLGHRRVNCPSLQCNVSPPHPNALFKSLNSMITNDDYSLLDCNFCPKFLNEISYRFSLNFLNLRKILILSGIPDVMKTLSLLDGMFNYYNDASAIALKLLEDSDSSLGVTTLLPDSGDSLSFCESSSLTTLDPCLRAVDPYVSKSFDPEIFDVMVVDPGVLNCSILSSFKHSTSNMKDNSVSLIAEDSIYDDFVRCSVSSADCLDVNLLNLMNDCLVVDDCLEGVHPNASFIKVNMVTPVSVSACIDNAHAFSYHSDNKVLDEFSCFNCFDILRLTVDDSSSNKEILESFGAVECKKLEVTLSFVDESFNNVGELVPDSSLVTVFEGNLLDSSLADSIVISNLEIDVKDMNVSECLLADPDVDQFVFYGCGCASGDCELGLPFHSDNSRDMLVVDPEWVDDGFTLVPVAVASFIDSDSILYDDELAVGSVIKDFHLDVKESESVLITEIPPSVTLDESLFIDAAECSPVSVRCPLKNPVDVALAQDKPDVLLNDVTGLKTRSLCLDYVPSLPDSVCTPISATPFHAGLPAVGMISLSDEIIDVSLEDTAHVDVGCSSSSLSTRAQRGRKKGIGKAVAVGTVRRSARLNKVIVLDSIPEVVGDSFASSSVAAGSSSGYLALDRLWLNSSFSEDW